MDTCPQHSAHEARIVRCETDIGHLYKSMKNASNRTAIMIGIGCGATFMISLVTLFVQLKPL